VGAATDVQVGVVVCMCGEAGVEEVAEGGARGCGVAGREPSGAAGRGGDGEAETEESQEGVAEGFAVSGELRDFGLVGSEGWR
jgi:hypothetical protein